MARAGLPSGTVTFLFTDIEGSTRLLHELGAAGYAKALEEHRRILRARSAPTAALRWTRRAMRSSSPSRPRRGRSRRLQRRWRAWCRGRSGCGWASTRGRHADEEGYVGVDVHRAARIAAVGHGGQVLVSASTATLVGTDGLRDLGEHRLKDLSEPERIYQLGDGEFPPLKSLHRTNLPVPATPFLGRERELDEVLGCCARDVRLLTLTGPGRDGKTRLALQAAAAARSAIPDGVWWVSLAPLRDPGSSCSRRRAQALGAKDGLAEHIGGQASCCSSSTTSSTSSRRPRDARRAARAPARSSSCS